MNLFMNSVPSNYNSWSEKKYKKITKENYNQIFDYYQKGIYPQVDRLIVIGDIHGDYKAFINVLKKAKIVDEKENYIGGKTHVVQVGDILDRKPRETNRNDEDNEIKIISKIMELQIDSFKSGGGYHPVLGNHELMNVLGIFDYASPMGIMHFGGREGRRDFFRPGSPCSNYFACAWNPVIKIGSWLFVHGGMSKKISDRYTIEEINNTMRDFLYGNTHHMKKKYFDELFLNGNSILWNRDFSTDHHQTTNQKLNDDLNSILRNYKVKRICVGHTPQMDGIKHRFNGRIFNVDTGMSEAFGDKQNELDRIHFMEILGDHQKIRIY